MLTFYVAETHLREILQFLKTEATPKFLRLDDLTAVDESARRGLQPYVAYDGTVANEIAGGESTRPVRQAYPDYTLVYHLLSSYPFLVKAFRMKQRMNPIREEIRVNSKELVRSFKYPPKVVPKNCPNPWIRVTNP